MAAANIPIETLVDSPLTTKHNPNRLFEDRSGKQDDYTGAFVIYGLNCDKKKRPAESVCDAIWDMGFDAKPDFFKSVEKLGTMEGAPLVCVLKDIHMKLGKEMMESPEDTQRIHSDLVLPNKEVVISKFVPAPPSVLINFNKRVPRGGNIKALIVDCLTFLGIDATEDSISRADLVLDKYNTVLCTFKDMNIAKTFYNFRDIVGKVKKCPIFAITFYREQQDFYYDRMLLISGLNTKIKETKQLFLDVCEDMGVDIAADDIVRCEWLYSKAFKSKVQRSPLVVEFATEDKRVTVFEASGSEGKIRNDLRLTAKKRKPRMPRKKSGEEGDAAEEDTAENIVEAEVEGEEKKESELTFRKVYINPFISLPRAMMYIAARDLARKYRSLSCLPMSFYGKISLQVREPPAPKPAPVTEEDGEPAPAPVVPTVDELAEAFKALAVDGKKIEINNPFDLWKIDPKFRSTALDNFYMYTDPLYADKPFLLEPYEWFSMSRGSEKRLSRRQLERCL